MIVVLIFLFLIVFSVGLGPVAWTYNSEILPEKGQAIATMVAFVCMAVGTVVFPIALKKFGIYSCFFFFGLICFLGIFFLIFKIKETKDLTQKQIEGIFGVEAMKTNATESENNSPKSKNKAPQFYNFTHD